jgi:acetyl-CoA carboxylase alpha subunit
MASLKKNLQIIHDSITKNVAIVSAQAKAHARKAAVDYMENRNDEDLRLLKHKDYEDTEAVLAWLARLEEANQSMPDIQDDEEPLLEFDQEEQTSQA